ncbi:MAG: DNA-directed RNA polymerase subunit delta [Acholeplasmatales bacterium]|nr:DNA-directed RNA polymerase subunit delta [Acholeplasmatales bacterium]
MGNQMSLIEIALEIMNEHEGAINIYTLIEETLAKKGVSDEDGTLAAKLYTDITVSSKFVFLGDDNWDLKSRQSLDVFDKDGSSFNSKEDYESDDDEEEENDDLGFDEDEDEDDSDEDDEDNEDDEDDDINFEDEEEDHEEDDADYEDDDDSDDSYDDVDPDEEKYNKIMDEYEDMYED